MPDTDHLPVALTEESPHVGMAPALAIWLDDRLFERAKMIAKYLAAAEGFVPQHLLNKPEACFAVVSRSLTWKLDPYAVACATYQTPGGRVGFEGKLCQAILENSGKVEGGVRFEHYGDWQKIKGKFVIQKSEKGRDYPAPTWTRDEAREWGLGVTVRAKIRGELDPREWSLDLDQCFPLNSTLWATDPKSQICYTAVRRFSNLAAPGLFMGVPFDREDDSFMPGDDARSINEPPPRPVKPEAKPVDVPVEPQQSVVREQPPADTTATGKAQVADKPSKPRQTRAAKPQEASAPEPVQEAVVQPEPQPEPQQPGEQTSDDAPIAFSLTDMNSEVWDFEKESEFPMAALEFMQAAYSKQGIEGLDKLMANNKETFDAMPPSVTAPLYAAADRWRVSAKPVQADGQKGFF